MAEEDEVVPFRYVQLSEGEQHHVFVIHDKTPDWWRLVATFTNKKRAEGYAEVENDIAEDDDIQKNWHDGDMGPAPVAALPEAPKSAIGPELLERARGQTTIRVATEVRYDDRVAKGDGVVPLNAPELAAYYKTPWNYADVIPGTASSGPESKND